MAIARPMSALGSGARGVHRPVSATGSATSIGEADKTFAGAPLMPGPSGPSTTGSMEGLDVLMEHLPRVTELPLDGEAETPPPAEQVATFVSRGAAELPSAGGGPNGNNFSSMSS
eukprot:446300-Pyramimonas_sp.AAC.1